jgi:hypothetical protein
MRGVAELGSVARELFAAADKAAALALAWLDMLSQQLAARQHNAQVK